MKYAGSARNGGAADGESNGESNYVHAERRAHCGAVSKRVDVDTDGESGRADSGDWGADSRPERCTDGRTVDVRFKRCARRRAVDVRADRGAGVSADRSSDDVCGGADAADGLAVRGASNNVCAPLEAIGGAHYVDTHAFGGSDADQRGSAGCGTRAGGGCGSLDGAAASD